MNRHRRYNPCRSCGLGPIPRPNRTSRMNNHPNIWYSLESNRGKHRCSSRFRNSASSAIGTVRCTSVSHYCRLASSVSAHTNTAEQGCRRRIRRSALRRNTVSGPIPHGSYIRGSFCYRCIPNLPGCIPAWHGTLRPNRSAPQGMPLPGPIPHSRRRYDKLSCQCTQKLQAGSRVAHWPAARKKSQKA